MDLTYRILGPDDNDELIRLFVENMPQWRVPVLALISGVFDDERLVGCWVIQPAMHAEPLIVDSDYRGRVDFSTLQRLAEEKIPKGTALFCTTHDDRVAKVVQRHGFSLVEDAKFWEKKL